VVEDHQISFHTEAVGVPHLVKVSYFPNWQAEGAEGPWRATPSLMVVVPTQEDVVISFNDTWPESIGKILTVVGLIGLVVVVVIGVVNRRRDRSDVSESKTAL
jgi:Trk-type K+ transport system membrane component